MRAPVRRFAVVAALLVLSLFSLIEGKERRVSIFTRGANPGEIFIAKTLLDSAGVPYVTTDLPQEAVSSSMVFMASRWRGTETTSLELDLWSQYVASGGLLVVQRPESNIFFPLIGVSSSSGSNLRYTLNWVDRPGDGDIAFLDDPLEKTLSLGDVAPKETIGTVGYTVTDAEPLALFEDGSAAVLRKRWGDGWVYTLGVSMREYLLLALLNKDYEAQRTSSNGFEPAGDVFVLFLRTLYAKATPYAVWKGSSPFGTRGVLMLTFDVDAQTAFDQMEGFAELLKNNGMRGTFNVTTSYERDTKEGLGYGGFYAVADNIVKLRKLTQLNQRIGSHSVGHFLDFDAETTFPMGTTGNTRESYHPHAEGTTTVGGTVIGELEVSKNLLEKDLMVPVKTFRSGHLSFNDYQAQAMELLGYKFDTSHSANELLTNFPFFLQENNKSDGRVTTVLEIPMTMSDVFKDDPIDDVNYTEKERLWMDITERNAKNGASTVLLIHPNRDYKLEALKMIVEGGLPEGVKVLDMESFGEWWLRRQALSFDTELQGGSLVIKLAESSFPLAADFSLKVKDGVGLSGVSLQRADGSLLPSVVTPRDNGEWEVSTGLLWNVARYVERSWSIRRDLCRLEVTGYPASPFTVEVVRKSGATDEETIFKPTADSGGKLTLQHYLTKGIVYRYGLRIKDAAGTVVYETEYREI